MYTGLNCSHSFVYNIDNSVLDIIRPPRRGIKVKARVSLERYLLRLTVRSKSHSLLNLLLKRSNRISLAVSGLICALMIRANLLIIFAILSRLRLLIRLILGFGGVGRPETFSLSIVYIRILAILVTARLQIVDGLLGARARARLFLLLIVLGVALRDVTALFQLTLFWLIILLLKFLSVIEALALFFDLFELRG